MRSSAWLLAATLLATPSTAWSQDSESEEQRQLEEELARDLRERELPSAPPGRGSTASSQGLSNLLNPAISANGLVLGGYSTRSGTDGAEEEDAGHLSAGLHLQEVELRVSAIVDPYFRADFTLAATDEEIGFEEAFLSTLAIPRVTIRAGQMYANVGRHNLLHTHAFPFLTAPLPWRTLLGPEGLKDPGVSVDVLLPLPFFAEINAQVFSGEWGPLAGGVPDDLATAVDETVADRRRDEDLAYVGHLKTLFELGTSTTLELGGTYVGGRNGFGEWTSVVAGDMTLKWRPIAAERYTSIDWTTEYVWVNRPGAPEDRQVGGAYTSLRYQFDQRWWIQGRGALLGLPEGETGRTWRAEALLAFVPSEFSALRLQYAFEQPEAPGDSPVHEVFLQAIVSIGSHPTHAY